MQCNSPGVAWDFELDFRVVGQDDGAEGQRVRAHGREQDGGHVGVNHAAARRDGVGGAARRRRQHHPVRLHLRGAIQGYSFTALRP